MTVRSGPVWSAALFNPLIVPHHNQRNLPAGAVRFIMSLRATGEGQIVDAAFARYLAGELTFEEQRRVRARAMTGRDLDDAEADVWIARSVAGFEDGLALFDDVLPTLEQLRTEVPGLRLGASQTLGEAGLVGLAFVGLLAAPMKRYIELKMNLDETMSQLDCLMEVGWTWIK